MEDPVTQGQSPVDPEEPEKLMAMCLREFGFDFEQPDFGKAWTAFKAFGQLPLPDVKTITIGFECFEVEDRDDVLWVSFMRRLENDEGLGWSCGCLLSARAPAKRSSDWHWNEHESLEQWFARVQASTQFQRCALIRQWTWEGFSE